MKKILQIPIECGEKTCSSEPGKFCEYVMSQRFGTIYFCSLFSASGRKGLMESLEDTNGDGSGRLLRHPKCLRLENRNEQV